jgi:hypothetical protein
MLAIHFVDNCGTGLRVWSDLSGTSLRCRNSLFSGLRHNVAGMTFSLTRTRGGSLYHCDVNTSPCWPEHPPGTIATVDKAATCCQPVILPWNEQIILGGFQFQLIYCILGNAGSKLSIQNMAFQLFSISLYQTTFLLLFREMVVQRFTFSTGITV